MYERSPSSPMARMMPPPIFHGSKILKVKLGPRQRLTKKVVIKKGKVSAKSASRYYTVVRKAPRLSTTGKVWQALRKVWQWGRAG